MQDPNVFLLHIRDSARFLRDQAEGLSQEAFLADPVLRAAFERHFEIIGEAVSKIDPDFRREHPGIPWNEMRGMRNIVAHTYWDVDYDVIWNTVVEDIPQLLDALTRLLEPE